MFRTEYFPHEGESGLWALYFEEKELIRGITEDQAMELWLNLDELLEEFLTLEESELDDEDMAD